MRAIVVATLNDGTRHLVSVQAESTTNFMAKLKGPLICLPICNSFYTDKDNGVKITPDTLRETATVPVEKIPSDICPECKKLFIPEKHAAKVVISCRKIYP